MLLVVMVAAIAVFAINLSDTAYLSTDNLLSIVRQTTAITVMAVPTVMVIAAGEIDLSFASVVPVSGFLCAIMMRDGQSAWVAVLVALGFGAIVGLVNGLVTVMFKIPSFVVTLGMMGILQGLSERLTNSQSVAVDNPGFTWAFGIGEVGPIPVLMLWSFGVVIIGQFILAFTPVGRAVFATGANVNAARYSGIKTSRVKIGALMASGVGGALAGLLYVGQFAAASYTLGSSDLLTVIAAVIIGGTVLQGGKGSVVGALVGSLLLGTLNNGLIIVGFADPEQLMVRGAIIIAAVIFSARPSLSGGASSWWSRRRARMTAVAGSAQFEGPPLSSGEADASNKVGENSK
jgi:ribose transport system permease protein